jgi:hypothetical protein
MGCIYGSGIYKVFRAELEHIESSFPVKGACTVGAAPPPPVIPDVNSDESSSASHLRNFQYCIFHVCTSFLLAFPSGLARWRLPSGCDNGEYKILQLFRFSHAFRYPRVLLGVATSLDRYLNLSCMMYLTRAPAEAHHDSRKQILEA